MEAIQHHPMPLDRACRSARPRKALRGGIWQGLGLAAGAMLLAIQQSKQRQALRHLDDRLLADIGVTREAAKHEAAKHFWG